LVLEDVMTNEVMIDDAEDVGFALPAVGQHSSLAVSLARAEVDQQITTAHAFPRSVTKAVRNILTLATLDEQTAAECIYALPRDGKVLRGASIRLAEIAASQWGNCRIGARVVHVDRIEKYVEAEGVFHDLETNMSTTKRWRRRISTKKGLLFNDDMILVTGNAACSIATRNAVLGGVPRAVWGRGYEGAIGVIAGDVKTLSERRERALKAFSAFGVVPDQVFSALAVGGLDDITLEHMPTLIGMHSSLKSGEATVEEMFPKDRTEAKKNLAADLGMAAPTAEPAKRSGPAKAAKPLQEGNPPHDPDTGEIVSDQEYQRNEAARAALNDPADLAKIQKRELPAVEHSAEPSTIEVSREHGEAGEATMPASPQHPTDPAIADLLSEANAMAAKGSAALTVYLGRMDMGDFDILSDHVENLKRAAKEADRARKQ
jgi:hypothetical protein